MTNSAKPALSLADLRVQIDQLDSQLLTLLNQRAHLAESVGDIKRAEGSPFFRPDRVAQVLDKIQAHNPGPLKNHHVAAIWREIMSACLALEAPQRVAVLGPVGTFCEQAAIEYFGSAAELIYCNNFDEVFHATSAGTAQYGVVGVENSTEGAVARSLDLFLRTPVHVIGEVSLLVRHNLLRQSAVARRHRGGVGPSAGVGPMPRMAERSTCPMPSDAQSPATPKAPVWPPPTPHGPAWPASEPRREFGLHVVAHAIQDEAYNRTRFAIITLPQTLGHTPASGKDCTSLVVSVPNKPGAVHDLLMPLKANGVSMTRFESRPAKSGQWEYYFYIDLDGHISQPHVAPSAQRAARPVRLLQSDWLLPG
jgi:chorismate mutase/prephenate dehydratase